MTEHQFRVSKTARFYSSGALDESYEVVCYCLHGYAQLAARFIQKFPIPSSPKVLFIAPEGLHRFYLKMGEKAVGASWMTREDRLSDIADYVAYLDQLDAHISAQLKKPFKRYLLGFSQGVSTAHRWACLGQVPFEVMINWAGVFPPDLPLELCEQRMAQLNFCFVYGDEDEILHPAQAEVQKEAYAAANLPLVELPYAGRHAVNEAGIAVLYAHLGWRF